MSTQPQVRRPSFWEAVIWWRFFVAIFLVSLPFFGLFFVPQLKEKVADYELRSVGLTKGQKFTNDIGMSFVYVKAGTFQMGRSKDETEFVLEDKAREVTLTKGYWISVTEVTQEQYEKIMGSNQSKVLGSNIPVHGVTWKNAVDFCRALSLREGRAYSLPTEAQWEFACKAGERAARYGPIDDIAWYFSNAKNPREVAAKEANGFGLHDMLGNVAEWCWDIDHIGRKRDVDPQGISERHHRRMFPKLSICREIRGGHFASTKRRCRATASTCAPQDFHSHWLGFRLVCYGKSKVVHTKRYDGGKLVGQGPVSFSVNGELFPKMGSCLRFVDRENKVIRFSTFDGKLRDKKEFRKKVVAPQRGRSFINSFDIEFLWVEPGTFTMGDKGKKGPTNGDWQSVWLTKGYWLSR